MDNVEVKVTNGPRCPPHASGPPTIGYPDQVVPARPGQTVSGQQQRFEADRPKMGAESTRVVRHPVERGVEVATQQADANRRHRLILLHQTDRSAHMPRDGAAQGATLISRSQRVCERSADHTPGCRW